ncbi:RDD family protein [Nocardioides alkalitolerans]|uniref:RDD family protein n=1 Tax=Nocardioides alkalitolerans TaxID=281714 RepID=UPI000404F963|nr:RDD family protein [Nocardioides alkalitolerans]
MSVTATEAPSVPAAEVDRRFLALVVDRVIGWGAMAGIGYVAWRYLIDEGQTAAGWGALVGGVLLVGLVFAVLTGTLGLTPGKALLGLRVVNHGTGTPIGVGSAIIRSIIVALATIPLGFGLVTLAWTVVTDPGRQRRGFHDQIASSVVLDVRPRALAQEPDADDGPRHVVNLTAMRLRPAPAMESAPSGQAATPAYGAPTPPQQSTPQPQPPAQQPSPQQSAPQQSAPQQSAPQQSAPQQSAPQQSAPQSWPGVPAPQQPAPQQPVQRPAQAPAASWPAPSASAPAPAPQSAPQSAPAQRVAPQQQPQQPQPPQRPAPQQPAHRSTPPAPPRASVPPRPAPGTDRPTSAGGAAPVRALWRVTFDTGESFVVTGLALVGRKPEPRAGERVEHLVPLPSSDMSLSKTHAQFHLSAEGALVVMDRGSTNGSFINRQGVPRELSAGRAATLVDGDTVRFGDREMKVAREG